ncbi:MAG: type IV toxin-antitoxin system AbiEi family antitoxin [bacterium]|nr:type IV toxin-antitoxin system AbiEi family antitoxin [bacterium]
MKVAIFMKKEQMSYNEAKDILLSCLEELPFLHIKQISPGDSRDCKLDICADVVIDEKPITIFAVIKKDGTPRAIREAAAQITHCLERIPLKSYGVVIAPYISEDAGAILDKQGVGYVDFAGNYLLRFDQVYVRVRTGKKPAAAKQSLRSIYSPKSARVLRLLLEEPGKVWKVQEIAARAEISLGQAWKVKDQLCAREWFREQDRGFILIRPEALLKDWARNSKPAKKEDIHDFYSFQKLGEVEYRIGEECKARGIPYAFAEFSGGARYAPVVRYLRAAAYVGGDIEDIADALELKKVQSGANVRLIVPKDSGVFLDAKEIADMNVVSPVQAYLDLCHIPGRGEEAAEAILDNVIKKEWDDLWIIDGSEA